MPAPTPPDVERRALALFEHLADTPDNTRLRARLLKNEPEAVLARLRALEASVTKAAGALPTLIPGSADCEGILPPPYKVGAFRLVKRIGRGGMGDVWEGQRDDGLFEQKVAIKLIQRHALARAGAAFEDERRFLAKLEHANIARLIDGGVTEDGLPWLAMEFIDGEPIDTVCSNRTDGERVQLFVKAADAVQYAHSRLVAHADLKPSNILVDVDGRVKLLDFGISGFIGHKSDKPTGSGPLTREFASPQRIAGAGPSVADDIFALGRTLKLILADSRDEELASIADKATEAEEAERYGSVAALINDLDRWRSKLPVSSMPDGWNYRGGKFVERHRAGVFATGAALILLGATSIAATSNYFRAERARAEAVARAGDARGTTRFMLFGLMEELEARPNSLALRVHVANVSQHYLDRLASATGADAAQKLEAATGLLRLAQFQAKPGQPNLRQVEAAKTNLDRAALIAARLAGQPARALLSQVRIDQALISAHLDNDTNAAERYVKLAGQALFGMSGKNDRLRGEYLYALASVRGWQGDYAGQIKAARQAMSLPQDADGKYAALFNSKLIDAEAEGLFYLGKPDESVGRYETLVAVSEDLHKRWPQDNFLLSRLARARWTLGTTLTELRRYSEALPILRLGVREAEQARVHDPADEETARWSKILNQAYAQNLSFMGRIDEAMPIFEAMQAETERAWRANPKDASRLRDHAMAVVMTGESQAAAGQTKAGCETDARARALFLKLKSMGKLTGFDADHNLQRLDERAAKNCATQARRS